MALVDACDSRPHDGACREGDESGLHICSAIEGSSSRGLYILDSTGLMSDCPLNE
jgi:hypothetical protein